jgi:hypothetical protein
MYEPKTHSPISAQHFIGRVLRHVGAAAAMLLVSLALGMAGYEYFEGLPWRDAFLNAAMLMGGMGPVDPLRTNGGKVFAGLYALYAGLVLASGLVFAPMVHRVLHRFHWERDGL